MLFTYSFFIGDITELTIDALAALDGNLLFQLTKTDLQQICDNDWHRIYGHINIQKNLFEKSHTSALGVVGFKIFFGKARRCLIF